MNKIMTEHEEKDLLNEILIYVFLIAIFTVIFAFAFASFSSPSFMSLQELLGWSLLAAIIFVVIVAVIMHI